MIESKLNLPKNLTLKVPGDKSISHRTVLFATLGKGKSRVSGFLNAEDPLNTLHSFSKLGLKYKQTSDTEYEIESPGKQGLTSSKSILDFGNAGTGIRLSAGLLSGLSNVNSTLTGDASLQKRPMNRIIEPLAAMGADIKSEHGDGTAPLLIQGKKLNDFVYHSKLSSAQVKSSLMLAAISSDVQLTYSEDELSRDHTENMLRFLGGSIAHKSKTEFTICPPYNFVGTHFKVPGDISSAAFFIVLGLLAKSGQLCIQSIGLNPVRIGIIEVLQNMGGDIKIQNIRSECGEQIGDILISPSELKRIEISSSIIPSIIDEIPILSIAGLFSKNGFCIRNAEDLRAKESDRIHSMVSNLRKLGVEVEEYKDGYEFGEIKELKTAQIETFMDHRIAMSFSILKTLTKLNIHIDNDTWIDTSFPNFKALLYQCTG